MTKMTADEEAAVQARLIQHVIEHGTSRLILSERSVFGSWDLVRRLQAIMDGPIPNAPHNHGALLREYDAGPSH
jgi:hypothetical protein